MSEPTVVVDGGDRACGELLLVLAARVRNFDPGTVVRLIATDPAAPLDVPAWCHLTGHTWLGRQWASDGRPGYDIEVCARARTTRADRPWRLDEDQSPLTPERTSP